MQKKKLKRRPIALLLALLMILGLPMAALAETAGAEAPATAEAAAPAPGADTIVPTREMDAASPGGACGANVVWSLNTDTGLLTISGTGAMDAYRSESAVPWYSYRAQVTEVCIQSGVTSIGELAFNHCTALETATLPATLTAIGRWAFWECSNFEAVEIPASVHTIEERAFSSSGLHSISIGPPSALRVIGKEAFYGCDKLIRFAIPGSVNAIGEYAFCGCDALADVTIPNSVTAIGAYAFYLCTSLQTVQIPAGATVGMRAFHKSGLTSLTIPATVTNIGAGAFSACAGLTNIVVAAGNPAFVAKGGVLFNGQETILLQYPAGKSEAVYAIPNSVTTVAQDAFYGSVNLQNVTIHDAITDIGDAAFCSCKRLKSIVIPRSVSAVSVHLFSACSSLASVSIPDTVNTIGSYAFYDCDALKSISLPNSLSVIGDSAFKSCGGLTIMVIPQNVRSIASNAFNYCGRLTDFYFYGAAPTGVKENAMNRSFPADSVLHYLYEKAATGWTSPTWNGYQTAVWDGVLPGESLPAPALTLARTAANNVGLTWTAATGATGYSVYRGATAANLTWYASAPNPWYSDTGAAAGSTYYYKVKAYKSGGGSTVYSSLSNMAAAAVPAASVLTTPRLTLVRNLANNVGLTWTAVPGATGYSVYRGTTAANLTWYASATNPWYSDTGAAAGSTYYYKVKAYKSGGSTVYSSFSNTVVANIPAPPAVPVLTLARAIANNVGLTWTAVPGATGYSVYRGTTANNLTWRASATNPWYSDTTAAAGSTWYYQVVAYKSGTPAVYSGRSNTVAATLSQGVSLAPVLTLARALKNDVGLTWTATAGAAQYQVYKGPSTSNLSLYATCTNPWYIDRTAASGVCNSYRVVAIVPSNTNAAFGLQSNIVTACVPAEAAVTLDTPSIYLVAIDPAGLNIWFKWNAVAGASGYNVYRRVGSSSSYDKIGTAAATDAPSYSDRTVVPGETYFYEVEAYANTDAGAVYSARGDTGALITE